MGAESIVEGTILSIAKNVGDYVAAEEMVAEIETDKVTVEAKSPHAGTITAMHVEVDQTVEVGGKFFSIAVGVGEATEKPVEAAKPVTEPTAAAAAPPPPPPPPPKAPSAPPTGAAPAAPMDGEPREHRVKMTRMRLAIAKRLKEAQNETAMLTTFNEVDMHGLTQMRNEYKARSPALPLPLSHSPVSHLTPRNAQRTPHAAFLTRPTSNIASRPFHCAFHTMRPIPLM